MTLSSTPVLRPFISRSNGRVPRGELWLGADLFAKAGLDNDLEGHFRMVDRLGQDLLSLSISNDKSFNRSTGYRYFNLAALKQAQTIGHASLVVVIDGPFQTLISETGLVDALTRWHRDKKEFAEAYRKACARVDDLVKQCLDHSIAAIAIADDLAGERSAIVNPKDIQSFFLPFYTQTVSQIHQANATALFHSCGDIRALIPMIALSGFDGLAAIQDRINDLISITEQYRALSIVTAGIDADILEADAISTSARDRFLKRIRALCASDGFVLGSCCGLYSGDFLERIHDLYRLVEPIG
jgi:hypothetical protein